MYPLLRLAWHCGRATLRPRLHFLEESVLSMRVWPQDLDFNLHLNNGRALTLMDIGRMDLLVRTGMLAETWHQRWFPLLGSSTMRFRASLAPFQRFLLRTRVLAWDEKWIFIQQEFRAGPRLVARGVIAGLFKDPASGTVRPARLLEMMGEPDALSPRLSGADAAWAAGLQPRRSRE